MSRLIQVVAIVALLVGASAIFKPMPRLGLDTRGRGLALAAAAMLTLGMVSGDAPAQPLAGEAAAVPPTSASDASSAPARPTIAIAVPTITATSTRRTLPPTTPPPPTRTTLPPPARAEVQAEVVDIVDGDTIQVRLATGEFESVRLIGIDTPERGEEYANEAAAFLSGLIGDSPVWLERDVSERDRFNRLLAYVWVGDVFVNEEMVRSGLAVARRYPPDISRAERLEAAQAEARSHALGAWSVAPATTTTAASGSDRAGCHPSYPGVCMPPLPPDLDCGDISHRGFAVVGDDPHGFDGDGDGLGCES